MVVHLIARNSAPSLANIWIFLTFYKILDFVRFTQNQFSSKEM